MRIRHRTTLWITFSGILASMLLSLTIFLEMVGNSYELLDEELDGNARSLIENIQRKPDGALYFGEDTNTFSTPYWIRIYTPEQEVLFESDLVNKVDLPLKAIGKGYTINTDIPLSMVVPGKEDNESAGFRVKTYSFPIGKDSYLLQLARPVENLRDEMSEQLISIGLGLGVSALFLVVVSYFVSGRILRPLRKINHTVREINEKTLGKRIPLGKNLDELHELSTSLNSMFDRLHYSFQRQQEFIANASHELKTPLTMLRLSLEEAQQDEEVTEAHLQRLKAQNKTLLRMQRLVNNLLDLSALQLAETCAIETFSLNELVTSIAEDFQPLMQERDIIFTVQIDDGVAVNADREKIKRMLINLLDNGLKYNEENGEINLHIRTDRKTQQVNFNIFNSGRGIPPQDLKRVFDQFYRVEKSRSTALGGSGLGLTIVKRIAELHRGEVTIQSKPGRWTQVYVVLPILSD